jgi:hypothetical protein
MRRITVPALLALAIPTAAAAQRCVGLPADMYISGGYGFEGRDGASGRSLGIDVRVLDVVVTGDYGDLVAGRDRETRFAGQVALLPNGGDRPDAWTSALCPLVHFDHLDLATSTARYPLRGERRTSFGIGVAGGIEVHTAYLQHIFHFAPRVDWYTRELPYMDGTVDGPFKRLALGYTVGLTIRAPGLFSLRLRSGPGTSTTPTSASGSGTGSRG